MLASCNSSPTHRDMARANKCINYIQQSPAILRSVSGAERVTVYTDASPRNHPDGGAQGGHIVLLTSASGEHIKCWVHWSSSKLRRVVDSSSSAETLVARVGADSAMWIQDMWLKLTGRKLPIEIITDSNYLVRNCITTKLPAERRLRSTLAILREMLRKGECRVTWTPDPGQLTNALTKMNNTLSPSMTLKASMLSALRTGQTSTSSHATVTKTSGDASSY